jgi:hypothetical protein
VAHPTAPADRSGLRLSEVARHVVIPEGIVDSLWFDVAARCEEFGDEFDAWQDGLGQVTLGLRADGMFAATVGGVTFSIPRQVAKTFIVMRIVVALCTLYPGLTVIWTAHRMRTATNTFQKMKAFVLRAGVRPHLKAGSNNGTGIRDANGEQEIPFANGSSILFGAREQGFGRGFDEVDVEVFDEAQILTVKALEDMVAATNQSRFEHGALLFYMGTPPRPVDPGEVFTERRSEALSLKESASGEDFGAPVESGDSVYIECSGDPMLDVDDPRQVETANPSYPHRTPPVSVKRLRKNLPDKDSWRREGLGIWDDPDAASDPFGQGRWKGCRREAPEPGVAEVSGLAIAASYDLSHASIGATAVHEGVAHGRPLRHGPGTDWVPDAAKVLQDKYGLDVVIDPRGPAADLIPALVEAKVKLRQVTTGDVLDSCSVIFKKVQDRSFAHDGYPELDTAVAAARQRAVGDRWAWGRKQSEADISPLEAVTLATWQATQTKKPRSIYEDRGLETVG